MSPERRTWLEAMIERLAPRMDALRAQPGRGPRNCENALADLVAGFVAELQDAPAPAVTAISAELAKLEASLAEIQPRPGPYGLVINGCDMMDRVRHRLACRIAELRGEPPPLAPVAPIAIELPPVPEPTPFTADPQLGLFELAL